MLTRLGQIEGHPDSLRVLRRSLTDRRLHHSLIFHGPEAVGKRTVALAVAAALNCAQAAGTSDDACGRCVPCDKVARSIHPDVSYITLEKTVIPIEAIRGVRQEAAGRPYEGRSRVFIIDPADRLSVDAQNALLKTLEEPPSSSWLILITSRLMHLLPTTRSRCQTLAFGTLPPDELARYLAERHGLPEAQARRAARLAGGRYGAALRFDLESHDTAREELLAVLRRLSEPLPRAHVLEDVQAFGDDAETIASSLELLAGLVRDMMALTAAGSAGPRAAAVWLVHEDARDDLAALAGRLGPDLNDIFDRVRLARSDLERNVNRRLLVESLMLDIARSAARPLTA